MEESKEEVDFEVTQCCLEYQNESLKANLLFITGPDNDIGTFFEHKKASDVLVSS